MPSTAYACQTSGRQSRRRRRLRRGLPCPYPPCAHDAVLAPPGPPRLPGRPCARWPPLPGRRPSEARRRAAAARDWRQRTTCRSRAPGRTRATIGANLAHAWTNVALMEHASIAAFARFTLQLLALGAPPDSRRASNAAMADETMARASLAFAIASAYAGRAVGSRPAHDRRSLDGSSLSRRSWSPPSAKVASARPSPPSRPPKPKSTLATPRYATRSRPSRSDETRHAELAWRFVRWALSQRRPELRRAPKPSSKRPPWLSQRDTIRPLDARSAALLREASCPRRLRSVFRAEAMDARGDPLCAGALLREAEALEGSKSRPRVRPARPIETHPTTQGLTDC